MQSDSNTFIAYELHPNTTTLIEPAPIARDWMDATPVRHPYRCLPLVIANQAGWILRSPAAFRAYWYGGIGKGRCGSAVRRPDRQPDSEPLRDRRHHVHDPVPVPHAAGHQPVGEGAEQLHQGRRAAARRDRRDRLAGVHVHDELEDHAGLRLGAVREGRAVLHDRAGTARAARRASSRGEIGSTTNPELHAQYQKWEGSRKGFLTGLNERDPNAVKQGWQKDYFQGKTPEGKEVDSHQTKLNLREFEKAE